MAGLADGAIMQNMIDAKEVHDLANLARIKVTAEEVTALQSEITDIIGYVSSIKSLTTNQVETKAPGARYNVFRADEVTNEPRQYTQAMLDVAPHTHEGYIKVKQILNADDT